MTPVERKASFILGGIAAAEGIWVYLNIAGRSARFWRYMGFSSPAAAGFLGWMLAFAASAVFIWGAARRLPSVRENLLRLSILKILGILVAIAAGFCEEAIFRKWLMDGIQNHGFGLIIQAFTSALVFGLAHAAWGLLRGSVRASLGAASATSVLGLMLAIVYIASHRILAPCVVSHFLINLFIEPGLVLAAVRGEMGTTQR
jgi:membrane protease YdiL (CAAX protease family)